MSRKSFSTKTRRWKRVTAPNTTWERANSGYVGEDVRKLTGPDIVDFNQDLIGLRMVCLL